MPLDRENQIRFMTEASARREDRINRWMIDPDIRSTLHKQATGCLTSTLEMHLFGSFRASDRRELLILSQNNKDLFIRALNEFLLQWAQADWLDEGNVERVGRWISKNCNQDVKASVKQCLGSAPLTEKRGFSNGDIFEGTFGVFKRGLQDG